MLKGLINDRRIVCAAVEMVTFFNEYVVPWVDLKTQKLPAMDITGSGLLQILSSTNRLRRC